MATERESAPAELETSIGRNIAVLHRHGRGFFGPRLAEYGLPGPALPILLQILRKPGRNQDDIARRSFVDKTHLSRMLTTLEQLGYVRRSIDPDDSRVKRVEPTDRARELKPVLEQWLHEWNAILRSGLTEEEQRQVSELLHRMAATARQALRAERGEPECDRPARDA